MITSSGCVAQAWRAGGPRQALLAKLLQSVDERAIAPSESRSIAALCAKAAKSDIVDGHVALLASAGDTVLTSDTDDLRALLHTLRIDAVLHQC